MQAPSNIACWFEIYVADMNRAKKFYQAVFEREMMDEPNTGPEMQMCSFYSPGENAAGSSGALVKSQVQKPGTGGTLVYFSCEDCATTSKKINTNGGKVIKEKTSIGKYGFIAIGQDTEGNTIGLHSLK